jgi:hypothetical protein
MNRIFAAAAIVAFSLIPQAHGQYVPPAYASPPPVLSQAMPYRPVPQPGTMSLAQKCALASEMLKANNCGPPGCDVGLCVALQQGCRINWWGHHPVCPPDIRR